MEERILVYQEPAFEEWKRRYQWMRTQIQSLADGLKSLDIEPTDSHIKRLLNGESLEGLVAEKSVDNALKGLPIKVYRTIVDLFQKERTEDYNNAVGNQAAKIIQWKQRNNGESMINFDYYHIVNGVVEIAPEHIEWLEGHYCVFADSDNRRNVYDKWLLLKAAKEAFEETFYNATKSHPTEMQALMGITGDNLKPIGTPGQFSLAKLRYDGEFVLNGEYFNLIQ